MGQRIPGFSGEYLWELDIAKEQLLALAEAVPEEGYGWRPVEDARTFSAVLVHIAATSFALLRYAAQPAEGADLYGPLPEDPLAMVAAIVRRNISLEKSLTGKREVIDLVTRSFDAAARALAACGGEQLERTGEFFGERTTVRRVYLRMLTHTHEHMGQAVAYARSCGIRVPWPDPLNEFA